MIKKWSILIILSLLVFSCADDSKAKKEGQANLKADSTNVAKTPDEGGRTIINAGSTSQYTGKPGRLMVVAENTVYTDDIKDLVEDFFAEPIRPYYPATPYFEVFNRTPKEFKALSTRLRNVIELAIDENVPKGKPTMRIYENYYAKTQLYTKLTAHDMQDLYKIILNEVKYLFQIYDRQEWKREFYRHSRYKNTATRELLQQKFGIDLVLPEKYKYESIDDTYGIIMFPDKTRQMELKTSGISAVNRVNTIQSGIMIWEYPFKDSSQLELENLLMMRDTILKKYAKHEIKGVYMGTQYHPAVTPISTKLRIGDIAGQQIRGLYKFTGEMEPSGGRFWGFQFKHPYRNTIVAISGYIGAPPTTGIALELNQIRAVIYSLKPVK